MFCARSLCFWAFARSSHRSSVGNMVLADNKRDIADVSERNICVRVIKMETMSCM